MKTQDFRLLRPRLKSIARRLNISQPTICMMRSDDVCASSKYGEHSVLVTSGLVNILDSDEVILIVAHEMAHLQIGTPFKNVNFWSIVWLLTLGLLPAYRVRKSEFKADEIAAQICNDSAALASALAKIGLDSYDDIGNFGFIEMLRRLKIWNTHPPVWERMKRLRTMAFENVQGEE